MRFESDARSFLRKPNFLFKDSINDDVEVMLDDIYKWLRRLGEHRFFLPYMEMMFSLSSIQSMSLYRSMEWDLIEEQSGVPLGQISHYKAVLADHDRNVVRLLLGSLKAKFPEVRLPIRRPYSLTSL